MFKAWARVVIWRAISIWMIIKAVSLDNITKIVSIARDRSSTRIPHTVLLSQGDEEEPAKKKEKEQPRRLEENQAMRYHGSQKKKEKNVSGREMISC